MSKFIIKSPGRYIQEPGSLESVYDLTHHLGVHQVILITESIYDRIADKLVKSYKVNPEIVFVTNDTTIVDISKTSSMSRYDNPVIVGVGGGSVIDLAKHCAYNFNTNCVIIPTVCSSDAACTSMIVPKAYSDRDTMMIRASKNPDIVIVDPEVFVTAPTKYVIAGIGDALATYYEAVACNRSNGITMSHGSTPMGFINQARFLRDTLLEDSKQALDDLRNGDVSEYVESVVCSCIYHSGLLSENCGLSIAHAFSLAVDEVYPDNGILHGYKVAYGLLVQLTLEHFLGVRDYLELFSIKNFYESVGLPTTFEEIGIDPLCLNRLHKIAESISDNKLSKNVVGSPVDKKLIYSSLFLK